MGIRGIEEGAQEIDANEKITYTLDVSKVGSAAGAITNETMVVIRLSDGVDVTSSVTEGAMSVAGQVITLKKIKSLTEGEQYRVDVRYTKDTNDLESEFFISCQERRG